MTPSFQTQRLLLRPPTMEDAPSYQKHFCDYEVISQLARVVPWPYPENGALEFLQKFILPNQGKDRWSWGIFEKQSPAELIGMVDLWREGKPEHRGFWLGRKYWGRGYMTEAVAPVMHYAFGPLGFEVLVLSNAVGNLRSRRIKEKTGARLIGVREAQFVDPSLTRAETWELSKENWSRFSGS